MLHKSLNRIWSACFTIASFSREAVSRQVVTFISGQMITLLEHAPRSLFSWKIFSKENIILNVHIWMSDGPLKSKLDANKTGVIS